MRSFRYSIVRLLVPATLAVLPFSELGAADATTVSEKTAAYLRTIADRAEKIVAPLKLADTAKAARVCDVVAGHYRGLNEVQQARDACIKAAKAQAGATKDAIDNETKAARAEADTKVAELHRNFLERLSSELSPAQVDQIKDGMTYGVLPLTFRVYQEMLPNLTAEQKDQIHAWLVEAREHAIDGFTSDEKHAWFGKYKGRINNYLAKAGYDLKQAEKEMLVRQKAAAATK